MPRARVIKRKRNFLLSVGHLLYDIVCSAFIEASMRRGNIDSLQRIHEFLQFSTTVVEIWCRVVGVLIKRKSKRDLSRSCDPIRYNIALHLRRVPNVFIK